jgi:hypothetical protein
VKSRGDGVLLIGRNGGVGLTHRIVGRFEPGDFALSADGLQAALPAAGTNVGFDVKHPEVVALVCEGESSSSGPLPTVDRSRVPELEFSTRPRPVGPDFLRALRDASRLVRRTADHRYAFHRVLFDAPLGRVVATDGVALFVHGGWPMTGPAVAVATLPAWSSPVWESHSLAVGVDAGRVVVRCGAWAVSLPVDRAARMPRYDELLARLRRPAGRLALSEADAAAWVRALSRCHASLRRSEPVTVVFADRPSLLLVPSSDPTPHPAPTSSFVGPRALRVGCDADRLLHALRLGFRTVAAAGIGHPLVALDGPRRFVWAAHDPTAPSPTPPGVRT